MVQDVATRMVQTFVMIVSLVSCVLVLGLISHLITFYGVGDHALNSGVVIGTATHNVGYEWHGDPGFFVDGN